MPEQNTVISTTCTTTYAAEISDEDVDEMEERGGHWDFRFCGLGQFLVRFFGFRSQKLRFSGFGIPCGLRIFSNLPVGFRFLPTMMAVFRILLPNSFYGFSGFAKKGMHDKPSLFSSPYLARNCCQAAQRRYVG